MIRSSTTASRHPGKDRQERPPVGGLGVAGTGGFYRITATSAVSPTAIAADSQNPRFIARMALRSSSVVLTT